MIKHLLDLTSPGITFSGRYKLDVGLWLIHQVFDMDFLRLSADKRKDAKTFEVYELVFLFLIKIVNLFRMYDKRNCNFASCYS